jgi:two-component system sensor histidine kinase KdpD
MARGPSSATFLLPTGKRPSTLVGLLAATAGVAAATLAIYPLSKVAPYVSLSVVYLPVVLFASAVWGLPLGLFTSLASAAAFNFFHLPPVGQFTIADSRNWVALAAFTTVSVVASWMAGVARARTLEAERRSAEADLAATLARELLAGSDTTHALAATAHQLALALGLSSAAIVRGEVSGGERSRALPLRDADSHQVATLLVPRALPEETAHRLDTQVAPSLEALVAIALRRDTMQAEAVETAALRRSDDVKTALLRAVSHDLRSPLTAIVAAGHALGSKTLTEEDRADLSDAVVTEGERLASLVDKLLDLSKLQAGGAAPRREWVSIEDVVLAAGEGLHVEGREPSITINITPALPDVRADAAQLERAIANLLENAAHYGGGTQISVNAARVGDRVVVSVVDQGPGIAPADRDRIFEPFYRARSSQTSREDRWTGAGLGLAIAKGFVEGNGGTIAVESLPGQGSSFVVSLPLGRSEPATPRVHTAPTDGSGPQPAPAPEPTAQQQGSGPLPASALASEDHR